MKKYFMYFAACLMAAFVLTSCGDEKEETLDSLVMTSFTTPESYDGMKTTISFVDEKNAILKTEVAKRLLNGKEMVLEHVMRATYVAKNGTGELHIDKVNTVIGESVTPSAADKTVTMAYDLKSKTMTIDGTPLVITDFVAMEWKEAPLAGAGALPTLEELQGSWYGMAFGGSKYMSVGLEVRADGWASLKVMDDPETIKTHEGTLDYADGVLSFGICRVEMTPMDRDNLMTDVKVYMGDDYLCTVVGFMKDWN